MELIGGNVSLCSHSLRPGPARRCLPSPARAVAVLRGWGQLWDSPVWGRALQNRDFLGFWRWCFSLLGTGLCAQHHLCGAWPAVTSTKEPQAVGPGAGENGAQLHAGSRLEARSQKEVCQGGRADGVHLGHGAGSRSG